MTKLFLRAYWATLLLTGARKFTATCIIMVVAACATSMAPTQSTQPLVSVNVVSDGRQVVNVDASSEDIARKAQKGGLYGQGAGLLGLICGPYAGLCVPAFAGIGAVAGATTAGVVELAKPPEEVARKLYEIASDFDDRRDFLGEVHQRYTDFLPKRIRAGEQTANLVAELKVREILFYEGEEDVYSLVVRIEQDIKANSGIILDWSGASVYSCQSQAYASRDWLDEKKKRLDRAITSCVQKLGDKAAAELLVALRLREKKHELDSHSPTWL